MVYLISLFIPFFLFGSITYNGGLTRDQIIFEWNGKISPPLDDPDADTNIDSQTNSDTGEPELTGYTNEDLQHLNDSLPEGGGITWTSTPTDSNDTDYGSTSSGGDQDDDVPTLLSIRSKLHALEQSITEDIEGMRGISEDNESGEYTTLADIVKALDVEDPDTEEKDEKVSEAETEMDEFEEEQKTLIEDYVNNVTDSIPTSSSGGTSTLFEMSAGDYEFYVDPFEGTISHGDFFNIDWESICKWISFVIGLFSLLIYFKETLILITKWFDQVAKAPMSAPVTNLAVFGNSVGTVALMVTKVTLMTFLIGTTLAGIVAVIYESGFSILGYSGGVDSIAAGITGELGIDDESWTGFVFKIFFACVPAVSIISLVAYYWIANLLGYLMLAMSINFIKAST